MNETNPEVGFFFDKAEKWQKEFEQLRTIVLNCGLTEELKWGCPCYTFEKKLNKNAALNKAFDALTPGRQRAYIFYFSQPKQSKTRESRIEKYIQQILDGKGLND